MVTVARAMSATVSYRLQAVMRSAVSTDKSPASRAVTHAMLFANVSTTESGTVSCDTSCASSATMFYADQGVMSLAMALGVNPAVAAAGDSVEQCATIVMCLVMGRVVV